MTQGRETGRSPKGGIASFARSERGFNLVEVMVTTVVLSVGMIGASALQLNTTRTTEDALERTAAVHLAAEIIERMRANRGAWPRYITTVGGGRVTGARDCRSRACTPEDLAAFDLHQWEHALDGAASGGAGLVLPTGCIEGPGGTGTYTVSIAWWGRLSLPDAAASPCGRGSGRYDDARGRPDVHRRVLSVQVYLSAE